MKDLTSGYNRMIRPGFYEKETGVGIELYILGIPSVDDENMELNLDMYFRQVDGFIYCSKEIDFDINILASTTSMLTYIFFTVLE